MWHYFINNNNFIYWLVGQVNGIIYTLSLIVNCNGWFG